ncbi:ubiquinol-cytochrome c reductase cytochrome c1 subunit [Paracoccus versutus]|uniref:Cytochrome c1 n=1 Tax=Paracoccus versutus TaxID=34007 RepID=A0AAQ0KMH9_PARVE|nr:cytochrome c1 [Paracoccus versutus]KGJ07531.1 cytochrome C [Paracoccus versutus]REG53142.1 ubiquinol-cytochrome c reductase cytochrome c1 subunit [Paracoccus versutus]
MTLRNASLTAVAALTVALAGGAVAQDASTAPGTTAPAGSSYQTNDTAAPAAEPAPAAETAAPEAEAEATEEAAEEAPAEEPAAEEPAAQEAPAAAEEPAAEAEPAAEEPAATAEEAPAEAVEEAPAEEPAAEEAPAEGEAAEAEPAAEEPAAAEPEAAAEEAPAEEPAAEEPEAAAEEAPAEEPAAEEAPAEEEVVEEEAVEEAPAEHAEEAADSHAVAHIEDISFSFEGPFGTFDQHQLQRGLQVYTEVCSACHGLRYVPLRTLADEGGPQLPEDQVRAYAANFDITDAETGEDRPRVPTDHFPTVSGDGMGPDLSLMAKARAGFHGPYGTGLSQLFNGIGGPEYIHAILTGYDGEEKEEAGTVLYHNAAFSGNWIQMAPPLSDDQVTYEDGTPATVDQMASDVAAFLMWTAEPKMMDRKQVGFVSVIFLIVLSALLYLTNKKLWQPIKHPRKPE